MLKVTVLLEYFKLGFMQMTALLVSSIIHLPEHFCLNLVAKVFGSLQVWVIHLRTIWPLNTGINESDFS